MKLVQLTEKVYKKLLEEGYTHLQLKSSIAPEEREFAKGRSLKVYVAQKHNDLPADEPLERIDSDAIKEILKDAGNDYYVSYKSS